jgi:hypothetical protein
VIGFIAACVRNQDRPGMSVTPHRRLPEGFEIVLA